MTLNTAVTYADSRSVSASGYTLAKVYLYRQLNSYIGSYEIIESKTNSYSSNAVAYANNVLGSITGANTISAAPDKVYTQLKSSTNSPNSISVMSYTASLHNSKVYYHNRFGAICSSEVFHRTSTPYAA